MLKKGLLIVLGFISLGFGVIAILIPLLPTFPFLVLTSLCFIKGSDKVNVWFETTKVYKKHLKPFKENRGMTLKTKLIILISVYIALGTLFIVKDILPMRIAIVILLIIKTIVFIRIKTIKEDSIL